MDWQRIARDLEAAFQTPKLELAKGRVFRAAEPLKLGELISNAVETDDEREELELDGPGEVLAKRWRLERLLKFEWKSLGPMSWFADLFMLDLRLPRVFVYMYDEALGEAGDDPRLVLAAIEPADVTLVSAFFRDLMRDDGNGYGLEGFFEDLPSATRNCRPDLIPAEVIEASYWSWMQRASRHRPHLWTDLREHVLRKALDPQVLRPFTETLREAQRNMKDEFGRRQEAASLSEEDRRRILSIYVSQSYREG